MYLLKKKIYRIFIYLFIFNNNNKVVLETTVFFFFFLRKKNNKNVYSLTNFSIKKKKQ